MTRHAILATVLASLALIGCRPSAQPRSQKPKVQPIEGPKLVYSNLKAAHFEYHHNGRLYVIGRATTASGFRKNPHLPYTKTFIGGGPKGETLVFEIDKKEDAFYERLRSLYDERVRVLCEDGAARYYEYWCKNRRHVIGEAALARSFKANPHLPYTKTYIGGGPLGETVVFAIDKKDDSVLARLKKEFLRRHPGTLD